MSYSFEKSFSELKIPVVYKNTKIEVIHVDSDGKSKQILTRPISKIMSSLASKEDFKSIFRDIESLVDKKWRPYIYSETHLCRKNITTCTKFGDKYTINILAYLAYNIPGVPVIFPFGNENWRNIGRSPYIEEIFTTVIIDNENNIFTCKSRFNLVENIYQIHLENPISNNIEKNFQDIILPAAFRMSFSLKKSS